MCYSVSVDLWSVGCVFAEILTGRPLLKRKNRGEKGTKAKYISKLLILDRVFNEFVCVFVLCRLNNFTKCINSLVHQIKNSGKRTSFILKLRCLDHNINICLRENYKDFLITSADLQENLLFCWSRQTRNCLLWSHLRGKEKRTLNFNQISNRIYIFLY